MSYAFTKSIDRGQPVHSAQADLARNFLLLVKFLSIKRTYNLEIHLNVENKSRTSKSIVSERACVVIHDVFGSSGMVKSSGFIRVYKPEKNLQRTAATHTYVFHSIKTGVLFDNLMHFYLVKIENMGKKGKCWLPAVVGLCGEWDSS